MNKYNGFNNGRDPSEGVGGKKPYNMTDKIDIKRFVCKDIHGNMQKVDFQFYRAGFFYYAVPDFYSGEMYEFPVPIEDIGNATMLRSDKAITFMRWIRKAIEDGTFLKQ
jgi:hypothetical protein